VSAAGDALVVPLSVAWLNAVGSFRADRVTTSSAVPAYSGLLTALVGDGESGKTWLAAHAVLDVVSNGGRALVVDGEMSAPAWRSRLGALGATDADLARVAYLDVGALVAASTTRLRVTLTEHAVDLFVLDSAAAYLATVAKSENDNSEVAREFGRLRQLVAEHPEHPPVAGLIVDHVARGSGSAIPRGATAKLNALDLALGVTLSAPPSLDGWSAILSTEKDRHGLQPNRCDVEATFRRLGAGALHVDLAETSQQTHRHSELRNAQLVEQVRGLDPPATSGNDAFRRLGGNRAAVLAAYREAAAQ